MHNHHLGSLKGQLLIAMPTLADPNFFHSVTCISEHTEEGALGVIVNRVHALISAKDIFEELDLSIGIDADAIPVHIGGPVHEDEVFVLHGPPFRYEASLSITDTLALSNSLDILKTLAAGEGPKEFLILMGCAGWAPGQLEAELAQNAWLTAPLNNEVLFGVSVENRWERAIRDLGIDPTRLSDFAGHA